MTGIINGQRAVTGDTALRRAHYFRTSVQFWLNLESLYDLRLAEQKAGKSIKALQASPGKLTSALDGRALLIRSRDRRQCDSGGAQS
jgi:antitoxin HigA-1